MKATREIADLITTVAANTDAGKQPGVLLPVYRMILDSIERYGGRDPNVDKIVKTVRNLLDINEKEKTECTSPTTPDESRSASLTNAPRKSK
jgi:hypothetical protein